MFLALMFVLTSLQVGTPDPVYYSHVAGMRWEFRIAPSAIDDSPRWRESDGQPPLAPRAAIRSAREMLGTCVDRPAEWELSAVSLRPISNHPGVWIYLIEFLEPMPKAAGSSVGSFIRSPLSMVVLMDGTAVRPTRQPWAKP